MKRFLACLLAVLMLAGVLASCNSSGNGNVTTVKPDGTTLPDVTTTENPGTTATPGTTETPGTSAPEVDKPVAPDPDADLPVIDPSVLDIIKGGKTQFTIIYGIKGYYTGSTAPSKSGAETLMMATLKKFFVEFPIKRDDNIAANSESYEILIGDTNRPESNLALEFAKGGNSYVIKAIGNKLVINSYSEAALADGIQYFADEIIKKSDGKTLTFSSENDIVSDPRYPRGKLTCSGYSYNVYTIVIPENAKFYEERMARIVQSHLAMQVGALLPIVYDNDADKASDFEILIGQTNRTKSTVTAGEYVFALNGAKIEINAGSVFAMELAADRVENEDMTLVFYNDVEYNKGDIERVDIATKLTAEGNKSFGNKSGDYRIISNNVWGWNEDRMPGYWNYAHMDYNSASQRNKMMVDVYMALDPDIILLQEYTSRLMRVESNHPINAELEKYGFVETPKEYFKDGTSNIYTATPIFYKTEKFDLVKNGCTKFGTGGGHDKFLTWAILQEKGTTNQVLVASVHHAYQSVAEGGETYRLAQIAQVVKELADISQANGNPPIILGGDFNCNYSSAPYKLYLDAGFETVNKLTQNNDQARGYYGGPKWNDLSDTVYMEIDNDKHLAFSDAIDHIIFKGSGITFGNYDILTDDASASLSDHMPVVVDFSFDK